MKYNPKIHNRRTIRLKGYDYSTSGLYFITICCQHKAHLLGYIDDDEMVLNNAGMMVEHWYYELQNKFNNIECREMVIMPNHFHCIIEILDAPIVGTDLCVCPVNTNDTHAGAPIRTSNYIPISTVVQWFKTMTTNHYIRGVRQHDWQPFDGRLWQLNYWERIIRDKNEHQYIADYIINNPIKWGNDKLNCMDIIK